MLSLANKTLVTVDSGAPVPRYRLLNTMRRYGEMKLAQFRELNAVASLQVQCMAALYEAADRDLHSLRSAKWH